MPTSLQRFTEHKIDPNTERPVQSLLRPHLLTGLGRRRVELRQGLDRHRGTCREKEPSETWGGWVAAESESPAAALYLTSHAVYAKLILASRTRVLEGSWGLRA